MVDDPDSVEEKLAALARLASPIADSLNTHGAHMAAARMNPTERRVHVTKRLDNENDPQVVKALALYRKAAVADQALPLTAEDRGLLGLAANVATITADKLLLIAKLRITELRAAAGPLDVPPSDEEEVGSQRLELEQQLVAGDAVVTGAMMQAISFGDFAGMVAAANGVYTFGTVPSWVRAAIVGQARSMGQNLTVEANLIALEVLQNWIPGSGHSAVVPTDQVSVEAMQAVVGLDPIFKDAKSALQSLRASRLEEERQRAREEVAQKKKEWHELSLPDLPHAAHEAARLLGDEQFLKLIGVREFPWVNSAVNVTAGKREAGFEVPLGSIHSCNYLQSVVWAARRKDVTVTRDAQSGVLSQLSIMIEHSSVFNEVVDAVGRAIKVDFTGYSLDDYKSLEPWLKNWREVLSQIARGYALGVIEGACKASDDQIRAAGVALNLRIDAPVYRQEMLADAFSLLFGEKHCADRAKAKELTPAQLDDALAVLGLQTEAGGLPEEARQRLLAFLTEPRSYASYMKISQERKAAAEKKIKEDDQALVEARVAFNTKLADIHARQSELATYYQKDYIAALQYMREIRSFQQNLPEATEVVTFDKGVLNAKEGVQVLRHLSLDSTQQFMNKLAPAVATVGQRIYPLEKKRLESQKYRLDPHGLGDSALHLNSYGGEVTDQDIQTSEANIERYYGAKGGEMVGSIRDAVDGIEVEMRGATTTDVRALTQIYGDRIQKLGMHYAALGRTQASIVEYTTRSMKSPRLIDFAVLQFIQTKLYPYLATKNVSLQ